ncbi:hypothetical protein chiPu_0004832 [Chiloscyllium punctatum]|uniref:Uncharacterized protein n=1 Tax=Chiloscyllium punctatum TaxID=137246 RepID=A0A401S7Q2_CHIPU|nr:hypothetical protein [Chiloscyllium punctatum]
MFQLRIYSARGSSHQNFNQGRHLRGVNGREEFEAASIRGAKISRCVAGIPKSQALGISQSESRRKLLLTPSNCELQNPLLPPRHTQHLSVSSPSLSAETLSDK